MSDKHTEPTREKKPAAPPAAEGPAVHVPTPPGLDPSTMETKHKNGVSPFMENNAALTAPTGKLTRKRRLTVDVTNISKLGELLCMTQSDLYTRELPSTFHPSGKAIAYCVDVLDLLTQEEYMLACNTVLASALQRAGTPLAGRYFAMRCGEVVAGKRYRRVDVVELEKAE